MHKDSGRPVIHNGRSVLVGIAAGIALGSCGMAVATTTGQSADHRVPAWMNRTCQTATSTDCFQPGDQPGYVHVFRGRHHPIRCVAYVDRLASTHNDYCRALHEHY